METPIPRDRDSTVNLFLNEGSLLERLLDVTTDAFFVVNADRKIAFWNRRAEELTGYAASEVLGRDCLTGIRCDTCRYECRLFKEDEFKDLNVVLKSKSGREIACTKNAFVLRDEQGNPIAGVEFLKDALQYHADYLGDTTAPPVGAIASSLANAKEKSALPLLLSHLRDHETPTADLVELTEAIVELGDVSAVPDLERFLVMYHADSCLSTNIDILVNVAEAIVKFGGEEGKAKVNEIIADPNTGSVLKSKLADVVK